MIKYKSFSLPGDKGILRIRSKNIIATITSNNGETIDIYCANVAHPFRINATKNTPVPMLDYIWHNPEETDDMEGSADAM